MQNFNTFYQQIFQGTNLHSLTSLNNWQVSNDAKQQQALITSTIVLTFLEAGKITQVRTVPQKN